MNLPALIARLAPVVYPTLLESYRGDCCVAAAAILTRVFREHGYKAEPVTVMAEVYNAAMIKLLKTGNPFPKDPERKRMLLDITGAWGVGIMPPNIQFETPMSDTRRPYGGGYGGHLLLRVNEYLVDATIKQADRPEKNIVLPAMVYNAHAEDLLRDGNLFLEVHDCHVVYRRINDESYRAAPDWQRRTTPYPETVRKILNRIKGEA